MKKQSLVLFLGVAMFMGTVTFSQAQTILSFHLVGSSGATGTLAPTDSAGVIPATNWNQAPGQNGGPIVLNDSTGAPSDVTLTAFHGGDGAGGPDIASPSTPEQVLFTGNVFGGDFGNNTTLNLSGLGEFSSYDLIVYFYGTTGRNATITASGSPLTYYVTASTTNTTSYVQSDSTILGSNAGGNYVEFTGLTSNSELITLSTGAGGPIAMNGFQIEGLSAAPEPSAWALTFGGLGLLIGFQQLRRRKA